MSADAPEETNEESEPLTAIPVTVVACGACGKPFERENKPGRPQTKCPDCRVKKSGRSAKVTPLDSMPPELVEMVAQIPLIGTALAVKKATGGEVVLQFSESSLKKVNVAFAAWLASIDVELTPGWALLAAYSMALADGAINAETAPERKPNAAPDSERGSGGDTATPSVSPSPA